MLKPARGVAYCHRLLVIFLLTTAGCASRPIASLKTTRPLFELFNYFAGHTHSWGIFETRSGDPKSLLTTTTMGQIYTDDLHFEQDLEFEGGKKVHRSWLVHRLDEHRYTATGTGIVGTARGTAYGNAFHLEFTLDAFPGNPLGHLHMSQWMYLQPDGVTLVNRDVLTKAGVIVAEITEQFRKDR